MSIIAEIKGAILSAAQKTWLVDGLAAVPSGSNIESVSGSQAKADAAAAAAQAAAEAASVAKVGDTMTGVLQFDPGVDDSAEILRILSTSADAEDFRMNISGADFSGTWDSIFNWGFNQTEGGGRETDAKHTLYLQLEYDFLSGGQHYAEYHLNLQGASGAFNFRPFEYKYNIDGSTGSQIYTASQFQVVGLAGADTAIIATNIGSATTKTVGLYGILQLFPNTSNSAAMTITGSSSVAVFTLDSTVNDLNFKARVFGVSKTDGTLIFQVNGLNRSVNVTGQSIFTSHSDAAIPLILKGFSPTQSAALIQARSSADAIQFAIGPTGQLRTNQTAANTNTPSGATAYQLPIYNESGTLLGYVPVYGSAW